MHFFSHAHLPAWLFVHMLEQQTQLAYLLSTLERPEVQQDTLKKAVSPMWHNPAGGCKQEERGLVCNSKRW